MIYSYHKMKVMSQGEPMYAFTDEYGRTIVQAVGETAARALNKYLHLM